MAGIATAEKADAKVKGSQATPEKKAESQRYQKKKKPTLYILYFINELNIRKRNELAKEIAHRIQQALPKEFGATVFEDDAFINFTFSGDEAMQSTDAVQPTSSTPSTTSTHSTGSGQGAKATPSSSASSSHSEATQGTKSHEWKVITLPPSFSIFSLSNYYITIIY
jgi:hypothetical protein